VTAVHRLPHRRGLDGLRALAVAAVLLYHGGISWVPGGFLGVDVFFAISGYLITSLLLVEVASTGGVALGAFWRRRARRLLPAVGALLVGVSVVALVGAQDAVHRLRGDVLAALTWSSNWWQIVRGETYFESFGRPPLLRHLWSLAVEEQLYIVLPIALGVLARRGWLARRRRLAAVVLLGAAGSAALLHVLWDPLDPSRAWFGTDTRAAALLVGVAFALLWPMAERRRWAGRARRSIDALALASMAGLGVLVLSVGDRDPFLHRWGFALTALFAGTLVVAVTSPSSRVQRYLGIRPLRWLGTRSYAVYLWHWPVFVMTRPGVDVTLDGWRLFALRLLVTGVLAELSWRVVEQPVRTGSLTRSWLALRRPVRRRVAMTAASATVVLVAAVAAGLTGSGPERPELLVTSASEATTATTLVRLPTTSTTRATSTTATTVTTTSAAVATTSTTAVAVAEPPPPPPVTEPPPPPAGVVLAVGDSVMLAAKDTMTSLSNGRIYVDAAVGRQVEDGLDLLQQYRDAGSFAEISALVVHLGTNGPMSDDLFNRLATIVDGVPRVVVLNVRVPKHWEEQSNAAINGGTTRFAAMRLGDWYGASAERGALASDGVHPSPHGARIYTYVTMRALDDGPPPTTTTTTTTSTTTTTTTTTTAPPAPLPFP